MSRSDDGKYASLRKYNLVMGFLHLIQATAMYLLSNNFALPVKTSYLQATGMGFPTPSYETWFSLRIGPMVTLFCCFRRSPILSSLALTSTSATSSI